MTTTTRLVATALLVGLLAACGSDRGSGGAWNDPAAAFHEDGSQASVESAISHELRMAALAMETAYTRDGAYHAGALNDPAMYEPLYVQEAHDPAEVEVFHDVAVTVAGSDAASYCIEARAGQEVGHLRSEAATSPERGTCP